MTSVTGVAAEGVVEAALSVTVYFDVLCCQQGV